MKDIKELIAEIGKPNKKFKMVEFNCKYCGTVDYKKMKSLKDICKNCSKLTTYTKYKLRDRRLGNG